MVLPEHVPDVPLRFLAEVDERFPGRLTGLFLHGSVCWGEFFAGSDIDFVAVWDALPYGPELDRLEEAHLATMARHPVPAFDGFHCTAEDLRGTPSEVGPRPVSYESSFDAAGSTDINLVTWHELAERPVVIRGAVPDVQTDLPGLLDFTRDNLDTYWRSMITQIEEAGVCEVGAHGPSVAWIGLGAARLHHLLRKKTLTSKSGAGRYVVEELDPRWNMIGREALRLREQPEQPSLYGDSSRRGQHVYELLVWLVEDGTRRSRL